MHMYLLKKLYQLQQCQQVKVITIINKVIKELIFKNYASFTDCIGEINNIKIDNAKDVDIVIPVHNLI